MIGDLLAWVRRPGCVGSQSYCITVQEAVFGSFVDIMGMNALGGVGEGVILAFWGVVELHIVPRGIDRRHGGVLEVDRHDEGRHPY